MKPFRELILIRVLIFFWWFFWVSIVLAIPAFNLYNSPYSKGLSEIVILLSLFSLALFAADMLSIHVLSNPLRRKDFTRKHYPTETKRSVKLLHYIVVGKYTYEFD